MVRGNGSARAETSAKATARPNTIGITMRRGPLRETPDDELSTITISIGQLHRLGLGAILCVRLVDPSPSVAFRTRIGHPRESVWMETHRVLAKRERASVSFEILCQPARSRAPLSSTASRGTEITLWSVT